MREMDAEENDPEEHDDIEEIHGVDEGGVGDASYTARVVDLEHVG